MKLKSLLLLLALPVLSFAQVDFNNYFQEKSLRFDFLLGGNAKEEKVFFQQMKKEPFWAGSKTNTIDLFNYGNFRFRVFDQNSGILLFSKGFSTLFDEWQTTAEAKQIDRTYYQTAVFPFPKNKIRLEIDSRQWDGTFKNIYKTEIDPKSYFILDEKPAAFETFDVLNSGEPSKKVDIVILAEGFTTGEKDAFREDVEKVAGYLFSEEPFKSEKGNFNIRAVFIVLVGCGGHPGHRPAEPDRQLLPGVSPGAGRHARRAGGPPVVAPDLSSPAAAGAAVVLVATPQRAAGAEAEPVRALIRHG